MTGMRDPKGAVEQMRENCQRDFPWFVGMAETGRDYVPICGGPSLRTRLSAVKARQMRGGIVTACNGAVKYLFSRGIEPEMACFVDQSDEVLHFIPDLPHDPIFLVASICHPKVFDRLEGRRVIVWHPDIGEPEQNAILDLYPHKPASLIGGGNTIGMRMLNIGYALGFRRFHFYGLDSSFTGDDDHAYRKPDGYYERDRIEAVFQGKKYYGASWMIQQGGEFMDIFYPLFVSKGCKIMVHGEGLIPDMCKALNQNLRRAA